jgi:hypothetical protein
MKYNYTNNSNLNVNCFRVKIRMRWLRDFQIRDKRKKSLNLLRTVVSSPTTTLQLAYGLRITDMAFNRKIQLYA